MLCKNDKLRVVCENLLLHKKWENIFRELFKQWVVTFEKDECEDE